MRSYLHLANASSLGLGEARKLSQGVTGVNAKTAVIVPAILGSVPFFWFANVLALCSLLAVLTGFDNEVLKHALRLESFFPHVILKAAMIALIAWIAQTYIQLVALPVLQVLKQRADDAGWKITRKRCWTTARSHLSTPKRCSTG